MLTIGEVAERTGLPPSTLRYYDAIGLVPAGRADSGHRRYDDRAVGVIELISLCQAAGFSLDEAAGVVSSADAAARRSLASAKLAEVDARIRELEEVRAVLAHFTRCQHGSGESEECARSVRAARARIVRSRDAGQR